MSVLMYKQRFKAPNLKSTPSKNYAHIRYIASRPRVMRITGLDHGLFGRLAPGDIQAFDSWRDVARHVYRNSAQGITMYRSVISFKREVAMELQLHCQQDWQRYVEKHILTIARENGIKAENLGWGCAAHDDKVHPHVHVAFWDKSARVKNPYTHKSIPDKIRKRLIKDTFAEKIRELGAAKDQAAVDLRTISDAMVDDFEQSIRLMESAEYKALAAKYEVEDAESELLNLPNDFICGVADRLFRVKAAMPPQGRIAYLPLPAEVKKQVDELVKYVLEGCPQLQVPVEDYVARKLDMVRLYTGSSETLEKAEKDYRREAEKMIANRLLGGVRRLFRLESELRTAGFTAQRRQYFAEQLLFELFYFADQQAERAQEEYHRSRLGGELSKEARKELYLKYQDKGYEH